MVSYSCIQGWSGGDSHNLDCATTPFVDARYTLPAPGSPLINAGDDAANDGYSSWTTSSLASAASTIWQKLANAG